MTLQEFNRKFIYKTDTDQYGRIEHWTVMEPDSKGYYIGDCEDYALTVQKLIPEYSDWDLWFCYTNGVGHCVLRKDNIILCNQCKVQTSLEIYEKLFNAEMKFKFYWPIVKFKMIQASVQRFLNKIRDK